MVPYTLDVTQEPEIEPRGSIAFVTSHRNSRTGLERKGYDAGGAPGLKFQFLGKRGHQHPDGRVATGRFTAGVCGICGLGIARAGDHFLCGAVPPGVGDHAVCRGKRTVEMVEWPTQVSVAGPRTDKRLRGTTRLPARAAADLRSTGGEIFRCSRRAFGRPPGGRRASGEKEQRAPLRPQGVAPEESAVWALEIVSEIEKQRDGGDEECSAMEG